MIVITGATGHTGRPAADILLSHGQKVRVIGRSADRLAEFAAKGAEAFVGELSDTARLTQAFAGADAVYALIPADISAPDLAAYQDRISDALAIAIRDSGVKYVVVLSSVGAHLPERTGPILGLRRMEQRIAGIAGINALLLRPPFFMENTLMQIPVIQKMGRMGGVQNGDLKIPMIATRDIGAVAATALESRNFTGISTRELLGQRDLSYDEAAKFIGAAIGIPMLSYSRIPALIFKPALRQFGVSESVADAYVEMSESMNKGYLVPEEPRTAANTTPTPF